MLDVTGIIEGPEGTPYSGGYFRVKFKFTEEFPAAPPKCWFATKIFHPNVSSSGEICVNTLKKDWKSSYGIGHILVTVKCLLIYPNPESALDEEAGKLLLENYDDYCARARLITSVHATPRVRPIEFNAPAPSSTVPTAASSSKTPRKSTSPQPPAQPLQRSPSNTLPASTSTSSSVGSGSENSAGGEKGPASKDRLTSPSPLGTADANVAVAAMGVATAPATNTKAVKRSGAPAETKRKKALKRL
ncbi:hypothetical protein PLICRDRAFT_40399 [Plicaturopsis crispa FD-325 SS-3]|nr:hypothetical protein PLICRDRAFT_40399 [Plicaturopsis crispa FD-325 SS-3]